MHTIAAIEFSRNTKIQSTKIQKVEKKCKHINPQQMHTYARIECRSANPGRMRISAPSPDLVWLLLKISGSSECTTSLYVQESFPYLCKNDNIW